MQNSQIDFEATPTPESDEFDDLVPSQATLDGFALQAGYSPGLAFQDLPRGTALRVETRNSVYRMVVLDGPQRRALVTGGALFPEQAEVSVAGSTAGGSALKVGWIGEGLRLELSTDFGPVTTSRIRAVTVEAESARLH